MGVTAFIGGGWKTMDRGSFFLAAATPCFFHLFGCCKQQLVVAHGTRRCDLRWGVLCLLVFGQTTLESNVFFNFSFRFYKTKIYYHSRLFSVAKCHLWEEAMDPLPWSRLADGVTSDGLKPKPTAASLLGLFYPFGSHLTRIRSFPLFSIFIQKLP